MTEQDSNNNLNLQDEPGEPKIEKPAPLPGTTEFLREHLKPTMTPVKAAWIGLFTGAIVYQIAGGLLTLAIFGLNLQKAQPSALQLLQIASQVLFLLLPALMLSKTIYGDVTTVLRFRLPVQKSSFLLFLAGFIVLLLMMQDLLTLQNILFNKLIEWMPSLKIIQDALNNLDKQLSDQYLILLKTETFFDKLVLFFVVAVTPAICEEILFRGYIQTSFELKYSAFVAALVTAVFFALFHFNPFGLFGLFALGLYMGYAAYKTNSIVTSMAIHFLNNGFAILVYFAFGDSDFTGSSAAQSITLGEVLPRFLLLSALLAGVVYLIERNISFKFMERSRP